LNMSLGTGAIKEALHEINAAWRAGVRRSSVFFD